MFFSPQRCFNLIKENIKGAYTVLVTQFICNIDFPKRFPTLSGGYSTLVTVKAGIMPKWCGEVISHNFK